MSLANHVWEILALIFTLTVFFIAFVIFFENEDPSKTLAWLLVLVLLPVLGFILYLLVGRKFRKIRRYQKKGLSIFKEFSKIEKGSEQFFKQGQDYINKHFPQKRKLIDLMVNSAFSPYTINNKTQVLNNGEKTFQSFFEAIEKATHHIHLEFYIVKDDHIGTKMQELLIKKARQGVKVRLIYDGYGSLKLGKDFIKKLKENGVQTASFSPLLFPFAGKRIDYRNHRKILIVDGKIGFVGGINIGDEYLGKTPDFTEWRDTHLRIEGDGVKILQHIFLQDWCFTTREKIDEDCYYPVFQEKVGEELLQIAAGGPDWPWEPIMHAYFSMIATAEKSVYLTTPYFVPNESINMAIKNAALSGLDVRIILPGKPDSRFVLWASMSYVGELLAAGVKVYQYQTGFIHAKTLVVDGQVSSVGSANMDIRSFKLNFEVNAFIYNKKVSAELERDFFNDLKNCKEITLAGYEKRPFYIKFMESLARLFSPLL
ncbi:MAG: cardiolipin synthase [Clostridia bacterium]|nr:cardiolipin synthase [Clostridia bacterium]